MSNIEFKNINKSFTDKEVIKNISLKINGGKIYGLLGRNGVGKTTLLRLINNREVLTSGEILIDGENVYENQEALSKIYLMEEKNYFEEDMKISKIFKWTKEFYKNFNMDYALNLSKEFNLDINKKIKELSTGYSSILKIILALSSGAEILCFDEPVLGLDVNYRELFYKELLKFYEKTENTIIIATHLIEEIANIIEEVIILKDGQVIKSGEVEKILSSVYSITGKSHVVKEYLRECVKKDDVVSIEEMASFEKVIILGEKDLSKIKALGLNLEKVELQKLFISLTNKGER
ncbi:MAG: ATP-binding cassette domain-containing protein [Clostridium sp.]